MQSLDVQKLSATTTTPPSARNAVEPVAKLIDASKCIGCKACTVACFQWNDLREEIGSEIGNYDPSTDLTSRLWTVMRFNEVERADGGIDWLMRKDGCMHCEEPGCLKACPAPGAIVKYANGIVDIQQEHCIGCGYCVAGCPFNIPRISDHDSMAYKCTLCSDRVAVGLAPACVKACPTGCIQFGAKVDMTMRGEKRVADLKERGFANAALYDPQGVGGTHVMYVLAHGDKPELYSNLPADPAVSPWVVVWKGVTKPLMAAGMGLAILGAFFHYVTRGPIDERPESGDKP